MSEVVGHVRLFGLPYLGGLYGGGGDFPKCLLLLCVGGTRRGVPLALYCLLAEYGWDSRVMLGFGTVVLSPPSAGGGMVQYASTDLCLAGGEEGKLL